MGPILPIELHLFDSAASPSVDFDELARYCSRLLPPLNVVTHGDFIDFCARGNEESRAAEIKDATAETLAGARVTDQAREAGSTHPLQSAVQYERRMLDRRPPRPFGVLYDGFLMCRAYRELLSLSGHRLEGWTIIVTNQLFGTFEARDSRYHARVSIYGDPCLISTTGLVEAPARSRSYYLARGIGLRMPDEKAGEDFLERDDTRTTEVLKGYIAQSFFYYLTSEPFCDDRNCRLFNAHRQAELLNAQLGGDTEFCREHERVLAEILEEITSG